MKFTAFLSAALAIALSGELSLAFRPSLIGTFNPRTRSTVDFSSRSFKNTRCFEEFQSKLQESSFSRSSLFQQKDDAIPPPGTNNVSPLLQDVSRLLKRTSWFSWWVQTILTVISCTILLFAGNANKTNAAASTPSFFLSGLGLTVSFLSILWTWGNGTRLSQRLLRNKSPLPQQQKTQQQKPPNQFLPASPNDLMRRAIRVQVGLNLIGLFLTLLAAEEIVGILALKVLTAGNFGAGLYGVAGTASAAGFVQPLDILIVQANTNTLLSHFASLTSSLYLADRVRILQDAAKRATK